MALTINAYSTTSDNNHVEKVFTLRASLTGTLREPCSILKPEIVIERQTAPTSWTHIFIQSFYSRWYYINNIVSVGQNLWQLSCSVDVLETYHGSRDDETMLYGCTGIVSRNEGASDPTLTDTALPIQNNTTLTKITATVTDIANTWISSENILKSTLTLDNRYCQMVGLTPYNANAMKITTGQPQAFYRLSQTDYVTLVQEQLEKATLFNNSKTFVEYILANYWLPFKPEVTGDNIAKLNRPGMAADFDYSGLTASVIKRSVYTCAWKATIAADNTYKYKNYAPYRDVYVQFLPFGRIKLDNSILFASGAASVDVYFKVITNTLTGDSVLYYGMSEADATNFIAESNVRIDLPISENLTNYGQIAAGVATTVIAAAAAIESGGAVAALGSVGGVVGGMSNAANASRSASAGGLSGKFIDGAPVVLVYDNTVNANARNNNLLGMPLYESKKIANVYGYAEITNIHLEGFTATAAEKSELISILASGVVFDNAP